jgi:hypothetical protein
LASFHGWPHRTGPEISAQFAGRERGLASPAACLGPKCQATSVGPMDRVLWVWLSLTWSRWRSALRLVQPDTVVHWHRQGFRLFWRWKSRPRQPGRKRLVVVGKNAIRRDQCRVIKAGQVIRLPMDAARGRVVGDEALGRLLWLALARDKRRTSRTCDGSLGRSAFTLSCGKNARCSQAAQRS